MKTVHSKYSAKVPFYCNKKNIQWKTHKTGANGSIMSCQRDGKEYDVIEN